MNLDEFNYTLPEELIAQDPLENRTESRLLVLDKETGNYEHKIFEDIIGYLNKGDCLVINNTKVLPARLFGQKEETGGQVEILLLKRIGKDCWEILAKPGKKAKIGQRLVFGNSLKGTITDIVEDGNRIIEFEYEGIFEEILDELGHMPLPPYITHELQDKNRYQTVYAKHNGSAAAPTAGLHFTTELLEAIERKGITIANVTLHVGLGTFRPVKVQDITNHTMHAEYYQVAEEDAKKINDTKLRGGRVIAVGTTSCRTLESVADGNGMIPACDGWTSIFIYPGYQFKCVDALITNFHLPGSTLMMLISSFSDRNMILKVYEEAVRERYRFFSFGDAMFIQ